MNEKDVPDVEAFASAHGDIHRVANDTARERRRQQCACGETRPSEFRIYEPYRCKACRRAYNAQRKRELR